MDVCRELNRRMSFGSTYEGLKLLPERASRKNPRGFGSTYEGLKLERLGDQLLAGASFGSTYEGLKPTATGLRSTQRSVLAVPMRA